MSDHPHLPPAEHLPARRDQSGPPANLTDLNYASDPNSEPGGGGLLEYWRILSRRKGTVFLIAFAGALAGFLVTIPQQQIFQAHTTLEILSTNDTFLNQKQINPTSETGASGDQTDIQTQIRILQSESLIERVLTKLKSASPASETTPSKVPSWRKMLNLPDLAPSDDRQRALSYAVSNLKIRNVPQTRIIEVTIDSTSPKTAADFANALASEYIEQHLESHYKTTEKTGEWLGKQIDDMRVKLERSADSLQQYARQAGLFFSSDEKTNISEEKLRQVQTTLTAAQSDRISKQSRWEMANASSPEALPDILNDPTLQTYQAKLTELTRQIAELRATYTADNQKVMRIQAQIEPIQNAFLKARGDILKRIKNEYDESLRREKLLAADYGAQRGIVTGEGEKSIQYNILKREVDSNRQLYDAMLQQMKAATLASALQASNIRVVDPGKEPARPYKPSIPNSAGIGLLSGCFLGMALVIMQERANRAIQEPGETAFYTNLPELGVVPSSDMGVRTWSYGPTSSSSKKTSSRKRSKTATSIIAEEQRRIVPSQILPTITQPDLATRVELITWQKKPSMVAESFRATLVSILFSGTNGSRPRVMVVTSCSPAEGKSTIVSNLGIAVSEVNQRVLLIDADLRKPRLHEIFGLKNDSGLSDLLRSKEPLSTLQPPASAGGYPPNGTSPAEGSEKWGDIPSEGKHQPQSSSNAGVSPHFSPDVPPHSSNGHAPLSLADLIQPTAIPDLWVLTSGPATAAATSLLYSTRMQELLKILKTQFETIFLDTPPMLQIPDARVLGKMVDRVIMVVRAGKTTRDAALAARQRFSEDGTNILGTILNDWNPKRSPNGYYGYSGGYYGSYKGYGYERSAPKDDG